VGGAGGGIRAEDADAIERTEAEVAHAHRRLMEKNHVLTQGVNVQGLETEHRFS
jgi:hypothetical protein